LLINTASRFLNYNNVESGASPQSVYPDSATDEEEIKTISQERRDNLERGRSGAQELVFYADDFYICHQAIQLQAEALDRQDIKLELFINGKELINRLEVELDKVEPAKMDPSVSNI